MLFQILRRFLQIRIENFSLNRLIEKCQIFFNVSDPVEDIYSRNRCQFLFGGRMHAEISVIETMHEFKSFLWSSEFHSIFHLVFITKECFIVDSKYFVNSGRECFIS